MAFLFTAKNGGNSGPSELASIRMRLNGMEYVNNSNCVAVSYGGDSDEIECNILIGPGETKHATLTLKAPAASCPQHSVYNSRFAYIASNFMTEQALQNNVSNIVNTIIDCD